MKCPYCEGEVSSQSTHCPYCGRVNPEGVEFQKKIQEKIQRNKLLKPFLIKKKTPELLQKMLTRIAFILCGVMAALFLLSIGVMLWGEREKLRMPQEGSMAERHEALFAEEEDFYFEYFVWEMYEIIDQIEADEMPEREDLIDLLEETAVLLDEMEDYEKEQRQEAALVLQAFYLGYLGLSEQEASFLEPEEDGSYVRYPDAKQIEDTAVFIENKLREVRP